MAQRRYTRIGDDDWAREFQLKTKRIDRAGSVGISVAALTLAISMGYGAVNVITAIADDEALRTKFTKSAVIEHVLNNQRSALEKQLADRPPTAEDRFFSYKAEDAEVDLAEIRTEVDKRVDSSNLGNLLGGVIFTLIGGTSAGAFLYGCKKTWDDHREIKALEQPRVG